MTCNGTCVRSVRAEGKEALKLGGAREGLERKKDKFGEIDECSGGMKFVFSVAFRGAKSQ